MKKIEPIQIWVNGEYKTAEWILAQCTGDNLQDAASFYYQLFEAGEDADHAGSQVTNGGLAMGGQDYIDWNSDPDINSAAYIWIAAQLGLTLI